MNDLLFVIIDDEPKVAEALKGMITKVLFPDLRIKVVIANSVKLGVELIKSHQPDIVFLDVKMPGENGFALFDQVDLKNIDVVFTTAYSEYAIESINKYGCLGYLLKPISRDDLEVVFERFREKRMHNKLFRFINDSGKRILIDYEDILLFRASGNYCEIYLKGRKYVVSKTLKLIAENMSRNLVRVHRSYAVNLDHVSHYNSETSSLYLKTEYNTLADGFIEKVPVGEKYRGALRELFL